MLCLRAVLGNVKHCLFSTDVAGLRGQEITLAVILPDDCRARDSRSVGSVSSGRDDA